MRDGAYGSLIEGAVFDREGAICVTVSPMSMGILAFEWWAGTLIGVGVLFAIGLAVYSAIKLRSTDPWDGE